MVSLALISLALKAFLLGTLLLKHRCCARSLVKVCFGSSLLCLAEFVAGQPLSHCHFERLQQASFHVGVRERPATPAGILSCGCSGASGRFVEWLGICCLSSCGGMALHDLLVDFSAWACAPPLLATGPPLQLSSSSTLLLSTPFVVCSSSAAVEYVRAFGHHLQSHFIGLRSCPMPRCGVILSCPVISLLACCGPCTRLGGPHSMCTFVALWPPPPHGFAGGRTLEKSERSTWTLLEGWKLLARPVRSARGDRQLGALRCNGLLRAVRGLKLTTIVCSS